MRVAWCWLAVCLFIAGCAGGTASQASCSPPDNVTRVSGNGTCLVIKTFPPAIPKQHPVLFVVVHGDGSRPGPAVYHYRMAQALAANGPAGSVAVAMIRPGYDDDSGNSSGGSANGHRDNYTPTNIAIMGSAIQALKTQYGASRVVGIGHSGGAATLALILAKNPNLLDAAVLVSCPCDLPRWRAGRGPWTNSLSPASFIADIPANAHVVLVSGTDDTNTGPFLAHDYAQALTARGVDATQIMVPGADHDGAFRAPDVAAAAIRLAGP